MNNKEKGRKIRSQILTDVLHHPHDIVKHISNIFSITPQAVYRHLKVLEDESKIRTAGRGRGKTYFLGEVREYRMTFPLNKELSEDLLWRDYFSFLFDGMKESVVDMCQYGFTEMVNNAIDHSDGDILHIDMSRNKDSVFMIIVDNGEGIFQRIKRLCKLSDERHAIMELSKGKLTTDPDNHTGEGIFFTSRMFDVFNIESKGLSFSHDDSLEFDFLMDTNLKVGDIGTVVLMRIALDSTKEIGNVFAQFTEDIHDDKTSQFNKTVIPVKLAQYGNEKLVSRSQAKRLLVRVEKFQYVVFDFEGVSMVGQAFADEIFRVYANRNKNLLLAPINMNKEVKIMIDRAMGA